MKASKFTDAQKAFVVKQGEEGTPVAEICRKARLPFGQRPKLGQPQRDQGSYDAVIRFEMPSDRKLSR